MSYVRPPVNKINLVGKMARVMYKNILKNNSNNYYDNDLSFTWILQQDNHPKNKTQAVKCRIK